MPPTIWVAVKVLVPIYPSIEYQGGQLCGSSKIPQGRFSLSYSKFQFSYNTVPFIQLLLGAEVGQRNWARLAGVPGWPWGKLSLAQ